MMMKLILMYYDQGREALEKGASIDKLAALPVREQIGRFKYTEESALDQAFAETETELMKQLDTVLREKEEY